MGEGMSLAKLGSLAAIIFGLIAAGGTVITLYISLIATPSVEFRCSTSDVSRKLMAQEIQRVGKRIKETSDKVNKYAEKNDHSLDSPSWLVALEGVL
jgi:hypothetical protein